MSDLLKLPKCTGGDVEQSLEVIWAVLHDYQDRVLPADKTRQEAHDLPHHVGDWKYKELYETADQYDEQWDDICTAMAWIREATDLPGEVEAQNQGHAEHPDQKYIEAAKAGEWEGDIEVDNNAKVSHGDDPGAYVQAWVWVYDSKVAP